MDLFHSLKIVQHSNNEIGVFFGFACLNFNFEVEFSEDGNVLPKKYLTFPVIAACSFVFAMLMHFVTFL